MSAQHFTSANFVHWMIQLVSCHFNSVRILKDSVDVVKGLFITTMAFIIYLLLSVCICFSSICEGLQLRILKNWNDVYSAAVNGLCPTD